MTLNPCPFCNAHDVDVYWNGSSHYVECMNCHATGPKVPDFNPKDDLNERLAIKKWNEHERTK